MMSTFFMTFAKTITFSPDILMNLTDFFPDFFHQKHYPLTFTAFQEIMAFDFDRLLLVKTTQSTKVSFLHTSTSYYSYDEYQ